MIMTHSRAEGQQDRFKEADDHMKLAEFLHDQYVLAGEYQRGLVELSLMSDQPLEAENKVVNEPNGDRHAPAQYDCLLYGPRYLAQPDRHIPQVAVRFPVIAGNETWNDVFLQVWNRRGKPHDYLFNSQGLRPFRNALTDVEPTFDFIESRDLYTVSHELVLRHPATISGLRKIFKEYVWLPQSGEQLK